MQYSYKTGIYVIKAGELVHDAVYLNPFANFKQWYTPYGKKRMESNFRLNTVVLTKANAQSINNFKIHAITPHNLRGDVIKLGDVYACDDTHDGIMETIFSREELNYDELILEG